MLTCESCTVSKSGSHVGLCLKLGIMYGTFRDLVNSPKDMELIGAYVPGIEMLCNQLVPYGADLSDTMFVQTLKVLVTETD